MKIELYINSESPEAAAIQAEVSNELAAFHQLDNEIIITSKSAPPPPNTLGAAQVYQFIIEHADDFAKLALVLRSVMDVVFAILRRRNISPIKQTSKVPKTAMKSPKSKPKQIVVREQPTIIIKVGDSTLFIPTTSSREKSFIVRVTSPKARAKKPSR